MPLSRKKYHELLAPAGSMEAFFAALEAGADAVYCGLTEFSARARARNFTLEEMGRLAAYARREGRRLYVTLNTLIKEAELPRLVELLAGLADCRVDGLIIQDLGVWRLARAHFPELPLHASTQMTIHNLAGVQMLEAMGFSRGVLARELSLDEIAEIGGEAGIELEHFIHGALCFSVSGRCFFSSYTDGKSGNRGRCVQPCRRRYLYRGKPGFYFSTSDFCALEMVPQLLDAGVTSFKIEGRMKTAEYVATVVAAYRKVLDAEPAAVAGALQEARELLAHSYGRQLTTGFLRPGDYGRIVSPSRKGGIGLRLGAVEKIKEGALFLTAAEAVHVGDRLRIQPENDLAGSSFTVKELYLGRRPVKRAVAGSQMKIPTPFHTRIKAGDQLYKIATGKTFSMSEEACRRRLARVGHPPAGVRVSARIEGERLALSAAAAGVVFAQEYKVEMHPATRSPLTRETLEGVFAQTGHSALALEELLAPDLPPVVIPPSQLKAIRRDFYHHLAVAVHGRRQEELAQRLALARDTLLPPVRHKPGPQPQVSVITGSLEGLNLLDNPEISRVIIPFALESPNAVAGWDSRLKDLANRIVWDIPALIFGRDWGAFQAAVNTLAGLGFTAFRLNNLGHFRLFSGLRGIRLFAGPLLYVLNSQAALALAGLGVARFTLSLEDDRRNMADILAREIGTRAAVTVFSPIPLVTSRIPLSSMGVGDLLEAGNGQVIRLAFSGGLTRAFAGQDFSLTGHLKELQELGCREFVADLSGPGLNSSRGREIIQAVRDDRPLSGTSLFNYERGLE